MKVEQRNRFNQGLGKVAKGFPGALSWFRFADVKEVMTTPKDEALVGVIVVHREVQPFLRSVFQEALPNDSNRLEMLFASLAIEGHPMGKFSWGNQTTLDLNIPDVELQCWLHQLK